MRCEQTEVADFTQMSLTDEEIEVISNFLVVLEKSIPEIMPESPVRKNKVELAVMNQL
jgi:hypothetical protein